VPELIQALKNKNSNVRINSAKALETIEPKAKAKAPALIQLLEDQNNSVRLNAAYALAEIGPEAKEAIIEN